MNIHSHPIVGHLSSTALEADADRHDRILSAAERAFVRDGFQGASMQTIAAEARMSAGNLYRYFDSKEAIVSGLVARDQAMMASEFDDLARSGDIFSMIGTLLRRHLVETPIERHQLILAIWAEMARNPSVAARCGGVDSGVRARLRPVVEAAQRTGFAAPHIDPDFVVRVMSTVVAGLFKRRATEPAFDGAAEVALALGVFRAAFDGVLQPYGSVKDRVMA